MHSMTYNAISHLPGKGSFKVFEGVSDSSIFPLYSLAVLLYQDADYNAVVWLKAGSSLLDL